MHLSAISQRLERDESRCGRNPRRGGKFRRHFTRQHLRFEPLEERCLLANAALVADIVPGIESSNPQDLADINGTLYLSTRPDAGSPGIYTSDGTTAGTVLIRGGILASEFTPFDGTVFFGGADLGKTDGTDEGTVIVQDVPASNLMAIGSELFFVGSNGKGNELWVSDGTTRGTKLVKDILGGNSGEKPKDDKACVKRCGGKSAPNSSDPGEFTDLNGTLLFVATNADNGRELWRSDGAGNSTDLVKDLVPGQASSNPHSLIVAGGFLYFATEQGGLWKSDGTENGTVLVKQFSGAGFLAELNGEVFFAADDGVHGNELWKSDGTTAGTVMVAQITPGFDGSWPQGITPVGNDLYFTADNGAQGRELWKFDGATGTATFVLDINPGPSGSLSRVRTSEPQPQITNVNGKVYFVANDGSHGAELWQSDGTAGGTFMVEDIFPGTGGGGYPNSSSPEWLVAMNNKLYFTAFDPIHGRELWDPPAVGSPQPLTALQEQIFVGDFGKDSVFRYDAATGAFVDRFVSHRSGGLNQPYGVIFGPDANGDGQEDLYVSGGLFGATGQPRSVNRYDGLTGEFIDKFTKGGDLTSPRGIIFTPDGDLLVTDRTAGETFPLGRIARFDGVTGQYEGDFVTLGSGGYALPQGLVFGPSVRNPNKMDLYASSADTNAVLRFDGETGAFLGQFVATDSGGLDHPLGLTFGPGGDLYVVSTFDSPIVARFQGPSGKSPGAFVETFVPAGSGGLFNPVALIFGPDGNGDGHQDLYVTNSHLQKSLQAKDGSVKRYDGLTGAFIDTFIATKSGGLDDPMGLTFRHTDPTTLAYTTADAMIDSCLDCFTVTVGGPSSATSNVVSTSSTGRTDGSPAATGDTSDPDAETEPLPTGNASPLPPPTQAPGNGTTDDADLVDLVFSDPATLDGPLLGGLATALTG